MAFCKNCGAQLKEGATFCKNCGAKLDADNIQNRNVYGGNIYGQMPPDRYANPTTEKMKKTLNAGKDIALDKAKVASEKVKTGGKALWEKSKEVAGNVIQKCKADKRIAIGLGAASVAIVAVIVVAIVLLNMNKKVALDKCVTVSVYGYNTLGEAEVYVDEVAFMNEVADAKGVKLDEVDSEGWYDQVNEIHGYELMSLVKVSAEKTTKLSNGDEVKVKISFDNKKADEYGITFVGETYTYKVEGLEKLKEYDPFGELQVSFEGVAPNAYLEYYCDEDVISSDDFSADNTENLDRGDEVTITFEGDEEYLQSLGYKISKTSQKYICENVDSYVETEEQLTGESFDNMKKDAEDCIEKYFADNYESIKCSELTYAGSYILSSKNYEEYDGTNIVYIICSGTVSSKEKYDYTDRAEGIRKGQPIFKSQTVYMPIRFEDVIKKSDGTIRYNLADSNILGYTELPCDNGWSSVRGYTDGERMYNDLVLSNQIEYTYEVSENLTKFGKSSAKAASRTVKEVEGTDEDFIFPDSNAEYLTNDDLKGLSKDQVRTALNELYARRGYIFEDEGWKAYFEQKDWYEGTVEGEDFDDSVFNAYETANKDLIVAYEKKKGYR